MTTIREVFRAAGAEIEFQADRALLERLAKYQRDFVNRDEEHINFFGSNLAGVYRMRFRQQDRDDFFLNIANLDEIDLADAIKKVDYLDPKWKRPNDPMNLACIWMMHEIMISTRLTSHEKQQGVRLVALILMYKFMGSLLAHNFPFIADRAAMEAAMSSLSKKFAIKQAGTWGNLLNQRADEIASTKSIHYKTYVQFNSDKQITYMVNDIQGRLKELIKNIWREFDRARNSTNRIISESSILVFDGETVVREKSRKYTSYIRYMQEVLPERRNFIRDELVSVICDLMHTVPPRYLHEALEWMSLNYRAKGFEHIEKLVEETLLHCFGLISAHPETYKQGAAIEPLLVKLRALYTASRMSDPNLLQMRDMADTIANQSVKSKNSSVISGVRTAIELYVVLRALAMNHYRQSSR